MHFDTSFLENLVIRLKGGEKEKTIVRKNVYKRHLEEGSDALTQGKRCPEVCSAGNRKKHANKHFKVTYFANLFTSALDFIPPLGDKRIFRHSNNFSGSIRGCGVFITVNNSN